MLDRLFGFKVHSFLHVLGFSVLAFGLPMNKVLMSIGSIWGVSNLVLEGDFKVYWENLKTNKIFICLFTFFILHFVGLIWSENLAYGLHDIRVKLPLLAVCVALAARPIRSKKQIHIIFSALLVSLLITSTINYFSYIGWIGNRNYHEIREMSLFGSHIRYGILIVLGMTISFSLSLIYRKLLPFGFLLIVWFSFYTYYSQVITSLIALVGVFIALFIYFFKLIPRWISFFLVAVSFSIVAVTISFFSNIKTPIETQKLSYTSEGNAYTTDSTTVLYIEGENVYANICSFELEREWNARSKIPYNGFDERKQVLAATLLRYLHSKGLTKDGYGVKKLSKSDIVNIEKGQTRYNQLGSGFISRLAGLKVQLENHADPNGHSLLQRLEYWKAGWNIFKQQPVFGVGTGDVQDAFDHYYETTHSRLKPDFRLRAHNSYLTFALSFGIFGLVLFLALIVYYLRVNMRQRNFIAIAFILIFILTSFIEDTLESQMGACIFALFIGLFIEDKRKEEALILN
jgi:O-antigen ligase